MKICNSSFEILQFPTDISLLELCGRVCYKSEPKGQPEKFVKKIIDNGHHSVIEHLSMTVKFVCDRAIANELVRHRLCSFSQESTRYANYSKDKFGNEITVIKPCFWSENSNQYSLWLSAMHACEIAYMDLLRCGATPQEARSVLPNSLKTDIIITANIREWIHIFNLRCSKAAHPQIRQIMLPLLDEFNRRLPVLFSAVHEKYKEDIK